jgi:hypothetical protein
MKKSDIARLETKLKSLRADLAKLSDAKPMEEFLQIIHKPGFTTVAEGMLIEAIVASLHAQIRVALEMRASLLNAASRVELNPQPLPPDLTEFWRRHCRKRPKGAEIDRARLIARRRTCGFFRAANKSRRAWLVAFASFVIVDGPMLMRRIGSA